MKEWMAQLFTFPKNLESGKGPPPSSLSLPECLWLFDLCFLSFFALFELDFDLLDSLSSSLLEGSDDELDGLDSEDFFLECCANTRHAKNTMLYQKQVHNPLTECREWEVSLFLFFPNVTTLCSFQFMDWWALNVPIDHIFLSSFCFSLFDKKKLLVRTWYDKAATRCTPLFLSLHPNLKLHLTRNFFPWTEPLSFFFFFLETSNCTPSSSSSLLLLHLLKGCNFSSSS